MDDVDIYQQIAGKLSLGEVERQFILAKNSQGVTPKTLQYYQAEIDHLVAFADADGCQSIQALTPDLIRRFLVRIGKTRNKGGIHATWRPIRAMLYWFEAEYEPDAWRNPARKVKLPPPRPVALPGVTMEDYERLVSVCQGRTGLRDRAMFYCLLDSCARAAEFIALDVGDADLITGDVLIRSGKGGEARYVSFQHKSRRELRKYLKTRPALKKADPLFTNMGGERFSYASLVSLVRWRSQQAGIERPGLHDIRRAGALEMLRNGADVAMISRYLGHKSLEVTMRYLAISPDDLRVMAEKYSPVDHAHI